jgi:hypothetical protein
MRAAESFELLIAVSRLSKFIEERKRLRGEAKAELSLNVMGVAGVILNEDPK